MSLDARVQFFHLEWLGEIIHPANGKRLHFVQLLGESTDEDDGNRLEIVVGFEVFAYLVAVHLRHIDVQQDQVRGIAPRRQQRQLAAGYGADFIPAVLEHTGQHLEIGGGVVHYQDAGGLPGHHFWASQDSMQAPVFARWMIEPLAEALPVNKEPVK